MFRNIKNLSEYSLLSEKLAHIVGKGSASKRAAEEVKAETAPNKTPTRAGLDALRQSMNVNFAEHLQKNKKAVRAFVKKCRENKYKPNQWKEWNMDLLEALGYTGKTAAEARGIVRQLEAYLKKGGAKLIVEGKFGPKGLSALEGYMGGLDRKEGWVEGKTKAHFEVGFDEYYLTHDGKWVDRKHKEVHIEDILPKLLKGQKTNARQFFVFENTNGHTYYIDRYGNTYEDFMPGHDGPTQKEAKIAKFGLNPFLKQGEDPRQYATQYRIAGGKRYYRFPNGRFVDESGKIVKATEVVSKVTLQYRAPMTDGTEAIGIEIEDNKIAYYNNKGELVETIDKAELRRQAPKSKGSDERVAVPTPKPDMRPTRPEAIAEFTDIVESPTEKDSNGQPLVYRRLSTGKWVTPDNKVVTFKRVAEKIKVREINGVYKIKTTGRTAYFDAAGVERDGFPGKPDERVVHQDTVSDDFMSASPTSMYGKERPKAARVTKLPEHRPINELSRSEIARVLKRKGFEHISPIDNGAYLFSYPIKGHKSITGKLTIRKNGQVNYELRTPGEAVGFDAITGIMAPKDSSEASDTLLVAAKEHAKKYVEYEKKPFIDRMKPRDVIRIMKTAGYENIKQKGLTGRYEFILNGVPGSISFNGRDNIYFRAKGDVFREPPAAPELFGRDFYLSTDLSKIVKIIAEDIKVRQQEIAKKKGKDKGKKKA